MEKEIITELDRAEYSLFVKVIEESSFKAVLNEKPPRKMELITLPTAYTGRIIPADIFPQRNHPDVRIARRASTIREDKRNDMMNAGLMTSIISRVTHCTGMAALVDMKSGSNRSTCSCFDTYSPRTLKDTYV